MAKHMFPFAWRDNVYFGGVQPDDATHMRLVSWVSICTYQALPTDWPATSFIDCLRAIHLLFPKRYLKFAHNYAICCYVNATRDESFLSHIDNLESVRFFG